MNLNPGRRILATYLAVVALGAALSTLVYVNGKAVLETTMPLIERQLPLFEYTSRLKVAVTELEPILYDYYVTTNRGEFLQKLAASRARVEEDMARVERVMPGDALSGVRQAYGRIGVLADDLDDAIRRHDMAWDRAKATLVEVGANARLIHRDLDALVQRAHDDVYGSAMLTQSRVRSMIGLVVGFSGLILLVAAVIGYSAHAYFSEEGVRKRIAMFPEKNPNPVLRLSAEGEVLYANPGTRALLEKVAGEGADFPDLFPADLGERLAALRRPEGSYDRWEFQVGEHTLGCGMQYLPEFDVFHAYLSDITERKRAEEKLLYKAYHDPVTGLPNRRKFDEVLREAVSRPGATGAVALFDLDRFKLVNASLGHAVAVKLLQAVAGRLQRSLEECRTDCIRGALFYLYGDTFCLLVTEMGCKNAVGTLSERIARHLEEPFYAGGREFFLTASIGAAVYPADGSDAETLLKHAERALHLVKKRGGNGFRIHDPEMDSDAVKRVELESELRRALEHKELFLHYQPQADLRSGQVIGAEALLRWQSARRGFVSPAQFIPLAEETGLIVPIGEWVLRTACAQNRAWRDDGLPPIVVAVNISARQFVQPDFVPMVAQTLSDTGLEPRYLELEITESVASENAELTAKTLAELKALGVQLSIDDFGTGYSSLAYLKRYPIDKLKVDQSFVRGLGADESGGAIARAVIQLGHSLNLKVIAEGVETENHLAVLAGYACDEMQGYLFSRPVAPEALAGILAEGKKLALPAAAPQPRLVAV